MNKYISWGLHLLSLGLYLAGGNLATLWWHNKEIYDKAVLLGAIALILTGLIINFLLRAVINKANNYNYKGI